MKNRFIVLNYHQVPEQRDPMRVHSIDRVIFRQQISSLKKYFNVISLTDGLNQMQQGSLPRLSVGISFDDGYRDNYEVAYEELRKLEVPATFFIATDYLDGGIMWNDGIVEAVRMSKKSELSLPEYGLESLSLRSTEHRRSTARSLIAHFKYLEGDERTQAVQQLVEAAEVELPSDLMMSTEQIQTLEQGGMTIGAHTASHPILKRMTKKQCAHDIERGAQQLSEILGCRPSLFAYPNGKPHEDYTKDHVSIVEDLGFDAAFTTEWGYICNTTRCYEMPRVGFADKVGWGFSLRALKSFFEAPVNFVN